MCKRGSRLSIPFHLFLDTRFHVLNSRLNNKQINQPTNQLIKQSINQSCFGPMCEKGDIGSQFLFRLFLEARSNVFNQSTNQPTNQHDQWIKHVSRGKTVNYCFENNWSIFLGILVLIISLSSLPWKDFLLLIWLLDLSTFSFCSDYYFFLFCLFFCSLFGCFARSRFDIFLWYFKNFYAFQTDIA